MKKIFVIVILFIFTSCTTRDYKYNISANRGDYIDEYYTNAYVVKGSCVKFINYLETDTTTICGSFRIRNNQAKNH